jgi:putative transcriptional regulator
MTNTNQTSRFLSSQLLIAMPAMDDPDFFHGVTLICEHNPDGAIGIMVNRRSETTVAELLSQLDLVCPDDKVNQTLVYSGGPVHPERGFVLHNCDKEYEATLQVAKDIYLTSSRDVLEDISRGEGPSEYLVALGYAGWSAGQLEGELVGNSWLNAEVDSQILYKLPIEQRWNASAALLGIDINALSTVSGHA